VAQKVAAFGQALRGLDVRGGLAWAEERMFREFDSLSQLVLSGIEQAMIDARAGQVSAMNAAMCTIRLPGS
jgi:hypothetical protein